MGIGSFDFVFSVFPVIFIFIFALVIGVFISAFVKKSREYRRNNVSPVLTVPAKAVCRRADVRHHHHGNAATNSMSYTSSSTTYFVTFEFESGDRLELEVADTEYGFIAEGDEGKLTFQGTRYLGFER